MHNMLYYSKEYQKSLNSKRVLVLIVMVWDKLFDTQRKYLFIHSHIFTAPLGGWAPLVVSGIANNQTRNGQIEIPFQISAFKIQLWSSFK